MDVIGRRVVFPRHVRRPPKQNRIGRGCYYTSGSAIGRNRDEANFTLDPDDGFWMRWCKLHNCMRLSAE
jgi:hypothetical protein